jgi:NADPH2:quinone reductase
MENERVVITQYGDPSTLKVIHEAAPQPKTDEVRIRVEAAGVSFGDVLQRLGLFFAGAPTMPYTPGYDVVGTIDVVGSGVDSVRVGDRVAALTIFGGYARYVCVPVDHVVTGVPGDMDAVKAVALVLNYTTAFQMLRRAADVRAGQSILVYGASGGVGSAVRTSHITWVLWLPPRSRNDGRNRSGGRQRCSLTSGTRHPSRPCAASGPPASMSRSTGSVGRTCGELAHS